MTYPTGRKTSSVRSLTGSGVGRWFTIPVEEAHMQVQLSTSLKKGIIAYNITVSSHFGLSSLRSLMEVSSLCAHYQLVVSLIAQNLLAYATCYCHGSCPSPARLIFDSVL
eukprot:4276531-Amphidinium_carterae.1